MALVAAAPAAAGERADFALGLDARAPGAPSAMTIHILYKASGDPAAKPSPLRGVILDTPAGTRFVLDAVPACTASDEQLKTQGPSACPATSRVGAGTLTVMTGFGAPADPVRTNVTIFNSPGGFVEVVTDPSSGQPLGLDRARVEGSRATLTPPFTPGGPPEGESAIRQIDLRFDVPAYVRTPAQCPGDGLWRSAGTFSFRDGVTVTEPATTPCDVPAPAAVPPPRAARLVVRPGRLPAGRRKNLRLHVRHAAPG
ncbi:MAG TPA: hypothetical protein VF533_10115, partial [Solirubrobacteraceae bacterium]